MYLITHVPRTTYMHFKTSPVPFTSNKIMSKTKYKSISFFFILGASIEWTLCVQTRHMSTPR